MAFHKDHWIKHDWVTHNYPLLWRDYVAPWFIKSLYCDDFQLDCSFKIKLEETSSVKARLKYSWKWSETTDLGKIKVFSSKWSFIRFQNRVKFGTLWANFDKVWSKCALTTMADISVYKPHTTHNSSIRLDEGLTLETLASESLYGGPFTLIKPNYYGRCSIFAILLNVQNVCF